MTQYLKGNYAAPQPEREAQVETAEQTFEAHALQALGGSIAFVKKSASFVWRGEKKIDPGRPTR